MKAKFIVNNNTYDVIPEIYYSDLMDGTPDTISFSFINATDLSKEIQIKELCEIQVYDKEYESVGEVNVSLTTLTINSIDYTISDYDILDENQNVVGYIDTEHREISLLDEPYYYTDTAIDGYYDVRKDLKKHYYMCVSQITSEKLSTNCEENGYMVTVSLKEQTVLLKDCIRTDIAITPSLYPQVFYKDEEGNQIFYNIFETLRDATEKIVDVHNMCVLNKKIERVDNDVMDALSKIPCPNLTYRDLSTYSQLYDIFMRVGRIPFFSNGVLYGLKLEGNYDSENIPDLDAYSSISSIREENTNDAIYSSKVYNNLYDKEKTVVPQIFSDIVERMQCTPVKVYLASDSTHEYDVTKVEGYSEYRVIIDNTEYRITLNNEMTKPVRVYYNNYDYYDINDANIFSIGSNSYYVDCTYKADFANVGYSTSGEPLAGSASKINIPYNNGSPDVSAINTWFSNEYTKWTRLSSENGLNKSKCLLFVSSFNTLAQGIQDAREYSLELPYPIEQVLHIYACRPKIRVQNHTDYSTCTFGFELERFDDNRITESSLYQNLSSLQKRTMCYYSRGSNKINNVVCLVATSSQTQEDFIWNSAELYLALRSQCYVVEYKPILSSYYTNYDYCEEDNKNRPTSINNFTLPYSEVSDKQIYPIMEYNLQKGLDTQEDVKIVSDNINLLDVTAGTIVQYHGNKYMVNKVSYYINNITIEGTFTLTKNIIQNSLLSSYIDNVRVSSVISAESTVDRAIHIFAENKISLMDYNNFETMDRTRDRSGIIKDVGYTLSDQAMYLLGLSSYPTNRNVYSYLNKYPFRFDNAIKSYDPNGLSNSTETEAEEQAVPSQCTIKMCTGNKSIDDRNAITVNIGDFPLTVRTMRETRIGMYPIHEKTVNNIYELQNEIFNHSYYVAYPLLLPFLPSVAYYLQIKRNGNDYYESMFPPVDWYTFAYWPRVTIRLINGTNVNSYDGTFNNYRVYIDDVEFSMNRFMTEKMISTSGLITKVEYSSPSNSYATSLLGSALGNLPSSYDDGAYTIANAPIASTVPVFFNTTDSGCKLSGFGEDESLDYSLYSLPHIYDKAYYLDLRENPKPYLQYKTLFRGDDVVDAIELSSEIPFMSASVLESNVIPATNRYAVIKVPKFTSISNLYIPDDMAEQYINEHKYCDVSINRITDYHMGEIEISGGDASNFVHQDYFDYCLIGYYYDSYLDETMDVVKILKFNIKEGKQTDKLCIDQKIIPNI